MAAITICSDSGLPQNKVWHCFCCLPIYLPWSYGTRCHDLSFLNAVKDPLKSLYPDPWSQPMTWGRVETGMHGTDASEKLFLFSLPFLVSPWIADAPPLPSLRDWVDVTVVTPAPPFPPWSGPSPFGRSPELSTLSYFPALSSEVITPRSMFPYQTTVTPSRHQIRNSGSSKEHPYTHAGVILDSWKINASPEFSEEQ